jgi:hypothetical protein
VEPRVSRVWLAPELKRLGLLIDSGREKGEKSRVRSVFVADYSGCLTKFHFPSLELSIAVLTWVEALNPEHANESAGLYIAGAESPFLGQLRIGYSFHIAWNMATLFNLLSKVSWYSLCLGVWNYAGFLCEILLRILKKNYHEWPISVSTWIIGRSRKPLIFCWFLRPASTLFSGFQVLLTPVFLSEDSSIQSPLKNR